MHLSIKKKYKFFVLHSVFIIFAPHIVIEDDPKDKEHIRF